MDSNNVNEGLEQNDLGKLVQPSLHIDEYKSKMGDDEDICVLSFILKGKEPALDLSSFIEKGYGWVLDADVSSGEVEDGNFLVFVEAERNPELAENIFTMMNDIMNLTDQTLEEWVVRYIKTDEEGPLSQETLEKLIPPSVEAYEKKVGASQMESLRMAAGLPVKTTAPKNSLTDSMRFAAGLDIK